MDYCKDYSFLKSRVNFSDDTIRVGDITVRNYSFESAAYDVIIGHPEYHCHQHGLTFEDHDAVINDTGNHNDLVDTVDSGLDENRSFRFHIFQPEKQDRITQMIFLFHGFNEKTWYKYFPWAYKMAVETGKAVILFPIAFHMNRTPEKWNDKRMMFRLSENRKKRFPNVIKSSLSNVAVSIRLHSRPERFIWSGLQTYYDVIRFVEQCRQGDHAGIDPHCSFDFFSYSIGSLLAEILKLTNFNGYFTDSKLCMFCGGAVFNRLSPVSKFILDSEANVSLYSFLVEHIESHMKSNERLAHFLGPDHPEGFHFYSMLDYKVNREYREDLFRKIRHQVLALALKEDKVVPSYEVLNTLHGAKRDVDIPVEVLDFPYPYTHEDPFPVNQDKEQVNKAFQSAFDRICSFLR
jgi:hypothetical protein